MKILKVPLTDSYFITLFDGGTRNFSISKSGKILDGKDSLSVEFLNRREDYLNYKMIGKVSELTEDKSVKIFYNAELDAPYINYIDRTQTCESALESFKSFIVSEKWDIAEDRTCIIIPKPSKQLNGKKIMMEFSVGALDFGYGESKMDLEIFMTAITRISKSVKFSMKVPKFIHDKCMTDPDIKQRPEQDYIESDTIAHLHTMVGQRVNQAHNIWMMDNEAKDAKKVICINFASSETATRDDYNHAYTGQNISTKFNFFVAYETKGGRSSWRFFSFKKLQHGTGTTERGIAGVIDSELQGKRQWISKSPSVVIEWTQEREDFLTKLEEQFRNLSTNLNAFLKDLNEEKLELLLQNSTLLKLN